ncbi:uncharacterized protein LOC118183576 [Stegodyphus dumicola]|uniref:uncharacterized protein LOC118183576 n=1 Tax=Stegodyphus dumicola TaxID=202533 RepID=UPI0015B031F8|nr:uncharacterized protein LOC118183576 [Stegodyphus dumicola]
MNSLPINFNASTTAMTYVSSSTPIGPLGRYNKSIFPAGKLPPARPTVSLDPRPIVIPILSCVICFPVLAFAVICALRYRAQRLRRRDHLKRVQSGCRSVTLEIPAREKSSFYSKDSSSDPSLKGMGEVSQAIPDSPPLLSAPSTSGISSRRSSRASQHVKFMTTTAVLHGRTITGLNGRFKSTGKSQKIFWDEHSSHVECAAELERELSFTLNS